RLAFLVFVAAAIGTGIVLAIFHAAAADRALKTTPSEARSPPVPHTQQGTIRPAGQVSGTVYYPLPYASPPNLTLSTRGRGRYVISKQDEISFTWVATDLVGDAKKAIVAPDKAGVSKAAASAATADGEFAWEAKGVLAGAGSGYPRLFEQKG